MRISRRHRSVGSRTTSGKKAKRKLRWAYPMEEVQFFENDPNERQLMGVEGLDGQNQDYSDLNDGDSDESSIGREQDSFEEMEPDSPWRGDREQRRRGRDERGRQGA